MVNEAQSPLADLLDNIRKRSDLVCDIQRKLTAFRAVGPENAGPGEAAKARFVEDFLRAQGVQDILHVDAEDPRVCGGLRPNLVATIPGTSARSLWLFAHMDVVPEGEASLWESNPWEVVQKGDILYGRGVEDNQQALTSMLVLAAALHELHVTPSLTLKLVFLSDEECGNTMGMAHLLAKRPDLFSKDDLYIIPDSGSPDGSLIEIAEKSMFRMKFTVTGSQCHASTPGKGVNSLLAMANVVMAMDELHGFFPEENTLFEPSTSTFTPTMHEKNVEATNILPGQDIFWMDCRALPGVNPEKVYEKARELAESAATFLGASVRVDLDRVTDASETPRDSLVVTALSRALEEEGIAPKLIGIGGSTVACMLRHMGLCACAWSTILNTCHEPNEHSSISATLRDAAVFARILLGAHS